MIRRHPVIAPLLAALTLGTAGLAAATESIPYHQVRQDHPGVVDDAIAPMSNSDFHGTLNRISALLHRAQVRDLAAGDALDGGLPANAEAALRLAIADLHLELREAAVLPIGNRYVVLQVLDEVLVQRMVELYEGWDFVDPSTCYVPVGQEVPICDDPVRPPAYNDLSATLGGLRSWFSELVAQHNATAPPGEQLPTPIPGNGSFPDYNVESYSDWLDELQLVISGEPIIDYE